MRTLSMRIVTFLIEYLGEFEFIFEIILDYESGDQMGSFDAKNPPSKISCLGTFLNLQFLAIIVRDGHGGGWSRKINAWHLYTLMVYL
jgi:hypothetical protein